MASKRICTNGTHDLGDENARFKKDLAYSTEHAIATSISSATAMALYGDMEMLHVDGTRGPHYRWVSHYQRNKTLVESRESKLRSNSFLSCVPCRIISMIING